MHTLNLPNLETMTDEEKGVDPFRYTSGPRTAEILVVGESWGIEESRVQRPFVGQSGQEFTRIIRDAGFNREEWLFTNLVNARPPANDLAQFTTGRAEGKKLGLSKTKGLYVNAAINSGIISLINLIRIVKPKLIIAVGNWPLWALTDNYSIETKGRSPSGIMTWRGSQLWTNLDGIEPTPVLPIVHPAAVLRQWSLRQLVVHDLSSRVPKRSKWKPPSFSFTVRPDLATCLRVIEDLIVRKPKISVDLETVGNHINCLGIAWSTKDAICIPFLDIRQDELVPFYPFSEWWQIVSALRKLFSSGIEVVGQNFMYDIQFIQRYLFVTPNVIDDTLLLQHLNWPTMRKSLDFLSSLYCDYHCYWKDDRKTWHSKDNLEVLWRYNCRDAVTTLEICNELKELTVKRGLSDQYAFQMEQWWMALEMMNRGVKIDTQARFKMRMELATELDKVRHWLDNIFPKWVTAGSGKSEWYNSSAQLRTIFYDKLQLPAQRNRKTGNSSLDGEAMEVLKEKVPLFKPVFENLELLRSVGVFLNTFLNAPLDRDRIHCSYNVGATVTFRWSSSRSAFGIGTNLQNIPKGDED
jgi:uracil-DNA glycosylase